MNFSDLSAIALASLAGSLHCAAMCGPFLPLLSGDSAKALPRFVVSWRLIAYHLGRGLAYLSLGTVAGILGEYLEQSGALWGMRHAAAIIMACALLLAALSLAWPRKKLVQLGLPAGASKASNKGFSFPLLGSVLRRFGELSQRFHGYYDQLRKRVLGLRRRRGGASFAFVLGISTGLLPCGWLWSFVLLAATRESISASTLTMLAFWLGTLPVLSAFGHFAQRLRMGLGPWTPRVGALALAALAIWTLVDRWPDFDASKVPTHCEITPR